MCNCIIKKKPWYEKCTLQGEILKMREKEKKNKAYASYLFNTCKRQRATLYIIIWNLQKC